MLENFGPHPVSTSPFWSIINRATIPTLRRNQLEYKSEKEKVEVFKSILGETFSDIGSDGEFDQNFKVSVTKTVDNHRFQKDFVQFPPHVIQKALRKLKINSSPGADQIHNLLLKKLSLEYTKKVLFILVNKSIEFGMPKIWKEAKIIMIPKKDGMCSDPEKYRPISLTV